VFTGIIQELGKVINTAPRAGGIELQIELAKLAERVQLGDSISACGACLTLEGLEKGKGRFFLSEETLSKTWLGSLKVGDRVNLEEALRFGEPIGGHIVQGHVDGVGKVVSRRPEGEGETMDLEAPADLERYLLFKASIAVDGVSLTIAASQRQRFSVALIPLTLEKTNLRLKKPGDPVNLEADLLGKWVERLSNLRTS